MKAESVFYDVSVEVASWVSDQGGESGETGDTRKYRKVTRYERNKERSERGNIREQAYTCVADRLVFLRDMRVRALTRAPCLRSARLHVFEYE